jgi:ACS family tartrate transporter-like MFS transporter
MIVYLTHWFCARDRCRAIACFYIAIPTASLIGSPLAGWLLGVHWWQLTGWRWLFFLEGVPAILLGIVTIFYLTDWPSQAHWLPDDERTWLIGKLQTELQAKKKIRDHTIAQALCDRRVLLLSAASFVAMSGALGNIYWIPTFLKRLSGFPDRTVTLLLVVPALIGIAGMLTNAWHSDNKAERHLHTISPLVVAGLMYCLVILASRDSRLAISFLLIGAGTLYAFLPTFWAIPTMILCESAAAATLGLINSIGQLGGFVGPYLIGVLNDRTHSLTASFTFIALSYVAAAGLILCLRIHGPLQALQVNTSDRITN